MLDLVDAKPRVRMGLGSACLGVDDVDRHADPDELAHLDRPRADLDFAVLSGAPFAAPFFAPDRLRLLFAASSPLSRAHERAPLTARCHPIISSDAESLSIAGVK